MTICIIELEILIKLEMWAIRYQNLHVEVERIGLRSSIVLKSCVCIVIKLESKSTANLCW
jgi:hypothetical protein